MWADTDHNYEHLKFTCPRERAMLRTVSLPNLESSSQNSHAGYEYGRGPRDPEGRAGISGRWVGDSGHYLVPAPVGNRSQLTLALPFKLYDPAILSGNLLVYI